MHEMTKEWQLLECQALAEALYTCQLIHPQKNLQSLCHRSPCLADGQNDDQGHIEDPHPSSAAPDLSRRD